MSQSLAKIYIHLVFSTKTRAPLLKAAWREELFQVLGGAANKIGCPPLLAGGTADHVHMLFQLGRTVAVSEAARSIKSNSSTWVSEKRGTPASFHWQAGYAAFSVGQSNVEAVRDYIRRQEEHHANRSFQDEMREMFRRYEIEWDERYVWD